MLTSKDQELVDLKNAHTMEVDTLKVQIESLQKTVVATKLAKEEAEKRVEERAAEMEQLKADHNSSLQQLKESHTTELSKLKEDHAAEILRIQEERDLTLVEEKIAGYNEAMSEAADEIKAVQDQIYKGGYTFGLESAGLPREHELFEKVVLGPPGAFTVPPSAESNEETDE